MYEDGRGVPQVGPSLRVGAVSKDAQQLLGGFVLFGDVAAGVKLPSGRILTLRPATRQALHHFTRFDQVNQLVGANEADPDMGFMARLMALCSLPRTNPGNRLQYKRVNGPYTLGMSAGINNKLPFGNFPRPPDFIHPHDDGPRRLDPRQDEGSNM